MRARRAWGPRAEREVTNVRRDGKVVGGRSRRRRGQRRSTRGSIMTEPAGGREEQIG
jgi:hypothetical protein